MRTWQYVLACIALLVLDCGGPLSTVAVASAREDDDESEQLQAVIAGTSIIPSICQVLAIC